jgi:DNA (cytosine-5)-methyltransferase 1
MTFGDSVSVASLCSGYGGLELGLRNLLPESQLVWFAETDRYASSVMEKHFPNAPNLGNLTEIEDADSVDLVTAGFPCQPVSNAGKRKGIKDERWLIDDVCRIVRRVGARWLLLENVPGIFTANKGEAFYRVLAALAENGFNAEWTSVRASDVGAPHQRRRWFCLAYTDSASVETWGDKGFDSKRLRPQSLGFAPSSADADGDGHGQGSHARGMGRVDGEDAGGTQERERARKVVGDRSDEAASHSNVSGSQGTESEKRRQLPARSVDFGPYGAAIERWELVIGRPAPDPTDSQRRLNPRFVEWMMGLPDGWVTDIVKGRTHQLRILGNGVVPQQASYALRLLNEQVAL